MSAHLLRGTVCKIRPMWEQVWAYQLSMPFCPNLQTCLLCSHSQMFWPKKVNFTQHRASQLDWIMANHSLPISLPFMPITLLPAMRMTLIYIVAGSHFLVKTASPIWARCNNRLMHPPHKHPSLPPHMPQQVLARAALCWVFIVCNAVV